MSRFKRVISLLLVFLFVFNMVGSSVFAFSTGSNKHIQAFLSWGAGKQVSLDDFKTAKPTQDELRFLGIYLSNFYVPFGTELGSTDEITKQNKEDMKKALQTSLSFSDEIAESFVETILGCTRTSTTELKLYVSSKYQEGLTEVPDMPLNYYTVLHCMLGGLPNLAKQYTGDNAVVNDIKGGSKYQYGYFCTPDGKPVFDFDIDMSELTPSATAFIKCLESVDMESGYGTNFFDFKSTETGVANGDFKKINEVLSDSQACDMSVYGMKLYVDCFGNIIVKGANHQVIAVPGCMNPYVWREVDGDGKDVGLGKGGTAFNMISVPALALQSKSEGFFSNIQALKVNETAQAVEEAGDKEITVSFIGKMNNEGLKNSAYLKSLINYSMGLGVNESGNYSLEWNNNTLQIKGNASELVKIDKNKIAYDVLDSLAGDGDTKAADARGWKNNIAQFIEPDTQGNWGAIDSSLEAIFTAANEQLSGKKVDENTSKQVGLRSGTVSTSTFMTGLGKLEPVDAAGIRSYPLRLIRGNSASNITTFSLTDWSTNQIKELIKKSENGYKAVNKTANNYYNASNGGLSGNVAVDKLSTGIFFVADVGTGSEIDTDRNIPLFDSFVFLDATGAANYKSAENVDYKLFNVESYFGGGAKTTSLQSTISTWSSKDKSYGYTNMYKDIQEGKAVIPSGLPDEALVGIYVTYAFASLYDQSSPTEIKETIGVLGYKLNKDNLPTMPTTALTLSDSAQEDMMLNAIRDWLYYLLNPTEGFNYFRILISNKVNALLVGWHEDMVGSDGTGLINGTTYYRGDTGYVTTPELQDTPWTAAIINFFLAALPYLIILVMLLMVAVYLSGGVTLQRCIMGFVLFVFCISLPLPIINNIIGASNRVSSALYSEKFTYWALVQHESYSDAIDKAAESGDYVNYLRTLYAENAEISANQGSESVMLKWQTSKKLDSLMLGKEKSASEKSIFNSRMLGAVLGSSAYSGEIYLKDKNSLYMYRSYIDISNFSRYIHRGLTSGVQPIDMSLNNLVKDGWYDSLKSSMDRYQELYEYDRAAGYCNLNADGSTSGTGDSILRVKLPLSSTIVSDAYKGIGTVKNLKMGEYVGINQGAFNFSIPMFNTKSLSYESVLNTPTFNASKYSSADYSALAAYSLMSENVFYYFSWDLYESGLSTDSGSKEGFKKLLLGKENAGFFYNTAGNGEMKDFMDMRSLFTYTIPYLKQGNDLVDEWDNTYGLFFHEGVPTEEGKEAEVADNPELKQKYWHNLNVARLQGVWTPWVDLMYDCSYARPEKISYLGEEYVVTDPINPASYPEERPMIFSRSEMTDYGLKVNQLTAVERKIIECNDGMEERLFNLLNYYKFNDVVLNTAAAMNCSFEFNKTFSENGLLGENHNIYPQAFELADFSYDAFLRFILANTTSESMIVEPGESFYSNVVNHSSIVTAIMMIILDILSVYVVPSFKLFFVMGIWIMSLIMILMSAARFKSEVSFVKRLLGCLIIPMISFLLITMGFAFVISLFMGSGNSAVTGEMGTSISVGDPVVAMVIMIVIDMVSIYLYYKLSMGVWKSIVKDGSALATYLSGAVMGVGGTILGKMSDKLGGKSSFNSSDTGTPAQSSGVMGSSKLSTSNPATSATQKGNSTSINVFGGDKDSGTGLTGFSKGLGKKGLNKESEKDSEDKKSKIEEKIKDGKKIINKTTDVASKTVDVVGGVATKGADGVAKVVGKVGGKIL